MGAIFLAMLLNPVVALPMVIFTVLLVIWVYYDAEHKGQSGLLWALVVLFFSVMGVLAYVLLSGPSDDAITVNVDTEDEFEIRAKYLKKSRAAGKFPQDLKNTIADSNFTDPYLDRLMMKEKFDEAISYLKGMQKMHRDMNDAKGLANYNQYEERIAELLDPNSLPGSFNSGGSDQNRESNHP